MNAFKILDKEGVAIPINKLDEEVCNLFEIKVQPKTYCKLGKKEEFKDELEYLFRAQNWFDTIGWMIASENKSFQDILDYYADIMKDFIGVVDDDGNTITLETIYPYQTKLLNHWIEKGYIAVQVKEN